MLYRNSIITDDAARAGYGRDAILPNELNLHLPKPVISWRAPADFDETRFQVTERIQAITAEYRESLQQHQEPASDARSRPARTNTLLPPPIVPESRRSQRTSRSRGRLTELSDQSEGDGSSSHDMSPPASESSEPDRSRSRTGPTRSNRRATAAADSSGLTCDSESSDGLADNSPLPVRNRENRRPRNRDNRRPKPVQNRYDTERSYSASDEDFSSEHSESPASRPQRPVRNRDNIESLRPYTFSHVSDSD